MPDVPVPDVPVCLLMSQRAFVPNFRRAFSNFRRAFSNFQRAFSNFQRAFSNFDMHFQIFGVTFQIFDVPFQIFSVPFQIFGALSKFWCVDVDFLKKVSDLEGIRTALLRFFINYLKLK